MSATTVPSLTLYNAHEGSTVLCQYIGRPLDTVAITPLVLLLDSQYFRDTLAGLLRSAPLTAVSQAFSSLITSVPVGQTLTQLANSNGVCNWIVWANGVSAGLTLFVNASIQPSGL